MVGKYKSIVLASTSKYRQELLQRLGVEFIAVAPDYDEPELDIHPQKLAMRHAIKKATSLGKTYPDSLIIGSDQLLSLDDKVYGKPGTKEKAIEQLKQLQGKTHKLITAVVLWDQASHRQALHIDEHKMSMRELSDEAIKNYVEKDNPIDCAGAYKLESLGIALFDKIEGSDDTAIIGLPLLGLVKQLVKFGIDPLML